MCRWEGKSGDVGVRSTEVEEKEEKRKRETQNTEHVFSHMTVNSVATQVKSECI